MQRMSASVAGDTIVTFILFGAILKAVKGDTFITDLALVAMGRYRGGAAKVSIVASTLFGMVSGSAVSNVAVVGPISIPMMEKAGYPNYQAAAIEAVSSTGGQIMPPVMGITAFLMADFLAIPYSAGTSTLYYDGTNGSSAFDFAGGTDLLVIQRGSGITVNDQTVNPVISMAFAGDDFNNGLQVNGASPMSFSIVTDTTGYIDFNPADVSLPNDFNFTFAAYAVTGSGSVQFSLDGVNVGSAFNVLGGEYQAFNLDLPENFYGDADATLVATVTGNVAFDHIQINGLTAIPEPSTYAAILGAAALGFAMYRRRQVAAA